MNELQLLQQRIDLLERKLSKLIYSDRYIVGKTLELTDGRNIQIGQTTGTKIGSSATQKIGFWGATPTAQKAAAGTTAQVIADLKTWGFYTP